MNGGFDSKPVSIERRIFVVSNILLAWLIVACVLILESSGDDLPLGFFVLMTIAVSTIVASIIVTPSFSRRHLNIVLGQLVTLWIFQRVAEAFQFPSLLGGDTYAHLSTVVSLQSTGHLSLSAQDSTAFPAFHIFLLDLIQTGGLSPKLGFVTIALMSTVSIVLFYTIASRFLEP